MGKLSNSKITKEKAIPKVFNPYVDAVRKTVDEIQKNIATRSST